MASKDSRPGEVNFLVERYLNPRDRDELAVATSALRRSAQQVSADGKRVRFVRSIFVPEDETCFDLYDAVSAEVVAETAHRAGVSFDRIVACEHETEPATRPRVKEGR